MKKLVKLFVVACLLVCMLIIDTYAITTGRWDFGSGYRYAQKVAEEMSQEQEPVPEEEKSEIPQSRMDMLRLATAEQTESARANWKNYWNRGR